MAKAAFVQGLCVLPSASEPSSDGRLPVAEYSLGGRGVQPFGQRREDHGDLPRRGFQTIQGSVASSTERGVASLAAKGLDPLGTAMLAISDEGVDGLIGDAEVRALLVWTGEALVLTCLGAPRRLFTSHQRRTGAGANPLLDEGVEARQQEGQSSGERGLSRRWTGLRLYATAEWEG
jgi:hypothetical protein